MFKKIFISAITVFILSHSFAQQVEQTECDPNMIKNAGPSVDQAILQQRMNETWQRVSLPYTMRIQVVVFYKNSPTVNDAHILRNITNMANFYRPQNICFVLSDIEYVKDSAMADFNINNPNSLLSYTRPSYLTIFIHTDLGSGLNGTAYVIPNTYLSLVDDVVLSYSNISTMAHEMGHCFGLYHTFETYYGSENVARTGTCKNCETRGDFLCDTQADLSLPENFVNTACEYNGDALTSCGDETYLFETRNIMTYGRRSCRNIFTNGQGSRARDFILTETMLYNCIAPDILTISANVNYTGGIFSLTAKDLINVTGSSYNISGAAQMRMTSHAIRIGPGASFRPTAAGAIVSLKGNPNCD